MIKDQTVFVIPCFTVTWKGWRKFLQQTTFPDTFLLSFSPADVNLIGLMQGPGQQDVIFVYGSFQGISSVNFKITIPSH